MRKRFETLIALGLAASMLAGCAAGETAKTENAESTQQVEKEQSAAAEESSAAEESAEAESQYPDYLNLDSARPIVNDGEEITLTLVVKRDDNADGGDINEVWFAKFIEEKLNINLEIEELTSENVSERLNLMLASDSLPDMMIALGISNSEVTQYGMDGEMFLPLSDYFSEELTPNILETLEAYPEAKAAYTAPDGKMYTLPQINAVYEGQPDTIGNERVFIDTTYMEAIGMEEAPTTLDGFVDMLRAFKELDPAVMGVDEIYPFITMNDISTAYFMTAFGWTGTGAASVYSPVWDVTEGEVVIPALQEKYADYIRLLNTLYGEGLIHPDYYTMDDTEKRALMAEKKVGVQGDWAPYLSLPESGWEDFIAASPLSSQYSETPISVKLNAYEDGKVFVSADTEYPEVCMRLLDYFYSQEGSVYWIKGPMAGTEDTLGIVEGFTLDEDGKTIVFPDVIGGKYESEYDYQVNAIRIASGVNRNGNYAELYAQEMLGVEEPAYPELNWETNPDDNYRYLVYNAQHDYLVDALPNAYMTVEQNERYSDLRTVIGDHVDAETAKFVTGQRPLEEIDQFFEELEALGGQEYLELCREIYANYSR